mmetsp:Transcript_109675/g.236129  ORF Transcript_109675/g.236129 Transcript_109675/m.236129 type:complete len:113 (+) Transcript_109675:504-842(+)
MSGMRCGTTAVYSIAKNTFTINTNQENFKKVWISFACNKEAQYCVVFARLLVEKSENGPVVALLVRMKDEQGNCLPGIEIGSMGTKSSVKGNDNGWITFTNFEVPYDNLLDK